MPFRNKLDSEFVVGKNLLRLSSDLIYYDNRSSQLFVIPAGFICDGASIPQSLWVVFGSPFDFEYRKAAFLHDFLYRNAVISKAEADQLFYDALREIGLGYTKAQSIYLAVKFFGKSSYTAIQRAGENSSLDR